MTSIQMPGQQQAVRFGTQWWPPHPRDHAVPALQGPTKQPLASGPATQWPPQLQPPQQQAPQRPGPGHDAQSGRPQALRGRRSHARLASMLQSSSGSRQLERQPQLCRALAHPTGPAAHAPSALLRRAPLPLALPLTWPMHTMCQIMATRIPNPCSLANGSRPTGERAKPATGERERGRATGTRIRRSGLAETRARKGRRRELSC